MSLKHKLWLSFLIPTMMLLAVGIWTSTRMRTLGKDVGGFLADNERSIRYSIEMTQALERLDSGILLKIHGNDSAYKSILDSSVVQFQNALTLADNNITVHGERELLANLRELFQRYLQQMQTLTEDPSLENYDAILYPTFVAARRMISDFRTMNTEAMYQAAGSIIDSAKRAALPGDLLMLAAIVFALIFILLTQAYIFKPIYNLLTAVEHWLKTGQYDSAQIETGDELQHIDEGLMRVRENRNGGVN